MSDSPLLLTCWGCERTLEIPKIPDTNNYYPVVRCSKCGAQSEVQPTEDKFVGCTPTPAPKAGRWDWLKSVGNFVFSFANNVLCVPFVLCACGFVTFVGIVYILPIGMPTDSWEYYRNTLIALFLAFNTFFNYFVCLLRPPTQPPKTSKDPRVVPEKLHGFKFCKKCNRVKPPRAHHCSTCNKCIMMLDHHCIFTSRCIGHHNHRHFLLFLIWLDISVLFVMYKCVQAALRSPTLADVFRTIFGFYVDLIMGTLSQRTEKTRSNLTLLHHQVNDFLFLFIEFTIAFAASLGVTVLLFGQINQVRKGITQFEYAFAHPVPTKYNQGFYNNLKQIFGPKWWLWPWPSLKDPHHDGINFKVTQHDKAT